MNARINAVVRRREALVARSGAQRDRLAQNVGNVKRSLRIVDRMVRGVQMMRTRPGLSLLVAAVVLLAVPRRLLMATLRGVALGGSLLRMGRALRSIL